MVAIILQDSFLPTPASDLLFLGANLREIRSQSPEALAAKTQSICVFSGTSVSWQIRRFVLLSFFQEHHRFSSSRRCVGSLSLGKACWQQSNISKSLLYIYALYLKTSAAHTQATAHQQPPTSQYCGVVLLCVPVLSTDGTARNQITRTGIFFKSFSNLDYSAKYCPFLKKSGSFKLLLLCPTIFWYYFLKLTKFKPFYEGFTFSASYRGRTCMLCCYELICME